MQLRPPSHIKYRYLEFQLVWLQIYIATNPSREGSGSSNTVLLFWLGLFWLEWEWMARRLAILENVLLSITRGTQKPGACMHC